MSNFQWNILDTGVQTAIENMRLDQELLETLDPHALPILHFYEWKAPSITYGYFVKPEDFLNLEEIEKRGIEIARRPTGGGIVFHIWDLAFSVLIPAENPHFSQNTLDNYAFVNNGVRAAVAQYLETLPPLEIIKEDGKALDTSCQRFCMAQPTKYDVVLHGRKIAGAAQRKTKQGFLHQGTIAIKMPPEETLKALLLPETKVVEAIQAHTFPLMGPDDDLNKGRVSLRHHLERTLTQEIDYVTRN